MTLVHGVCSNKKHASTGTRKRSAAWWARDVWHIVGANQGVTLCKRDASDWLSLGALTPDDHTCETCAQTFFTKERARDAN